ncbi:Crp/Fnr family transcriptional regulator [Nubsella zeaxanthinifaciens]|uniref:Crp/Fnr family transcriptional regulator n=1 Tax=Nubsella zeaxanthinifaciens TaxID=392412 RepID=UPI000DE542A1|nr:Crp/Fnr family transcriptional regulator [Nubsella zeaxanthinifaciens]
MNNYWLFENVNLFSIICPHKYRGYTSNHPFNFFNKNEFIYFQGDVSDTIFLVNSGSVKIGFIDNKGEEYIIAYLKKGDIFGENVLLSEINRKEFAQAAEKNTSLCAVTTKQIETIIRDNQSFSTSIYKLIGLKLKKIERRYQIMLFRDAKTRAIEFIKDLKDDDKNATNLLSGEILINNPFSQHEIAKLIGTSRSTFNLILHELENEGFIIYQKKHFILKNRFLLES